MQEYREFSFKNLPVRTKIVDGNVWFVAKDIANILNLVWNGNTTLQAIPESWKRVLKLHTPSSGEQNLISINEAGLYKLTFRSNKPEAEQFTNYVCEVILPQIRKTGGYGNSTGQFGQLTAVGQLTDNENKYLTHQLE
jgi:prophage antirepressor-like protein